jgi:hypothetical protein
VAGGFVDGEADALFCFMEAVVEVGRRVSGGT